MINIFRNCYSHSAGLRKYSKVLTRLSSFTAQHIIKERSDETGTLLARFAKHIAIELQKKAPIVPTTIRYANYFPITDLNYLKKELIVTPPEQLPALIIFAFTYRPNADPVKFSALLNGLDKVAVELLPRMDVDTVLRTLYSLLFLIPNWITHTDFYFAAMQYLIKDFTPELGREKFIQLCFYLGLMKKLSIPGCKSETLRIILEKYLDVFMSELSSMDLAVIANAAYKTSTRIHCDAYNSSLVEEVKSLQLTDKENDALLITLLKSMRLQRIRSESVCNRLSAHYIQANEMDKLQTCGLVHIFAYFAENLWDNSDFIPQLKAQIMNRLCNRKKFFNEHIRCKDLATFLWCCSHMNSKLNMEELGILESLLLDKVDRNEFHYFPDQLVDSCLSLWMLGKKSKELLDAVTVLTSQSSFKRKNLNNFHPKVENRLVVLSSAVAIEEPGWKSRQNIIPFNTDMPAPSFLLKDRPEITMFAKQLATEEKISQVKIVCPINGINIPNILIRHNRSDAILFVELLTENQVLFFSKEQVGLLNLKKHLLQVLGHKVIALRPEHWQDKNINLRNILNNETCDQEIFEGKI